MRVGRTCDADEVVAVIEPPGRRAGSARASAHGQRSRAHRLGAAGLVPAAGTGTTYIEPGSPWENPFVESFNGRVRDELLNVEEFGSLPRSPGRCRGLADRVQHLPTPLLPRRPHPRREYAPHGPANQPALSCSWTTNRGPSVRRAVRTRHGSSRCRRLRPPATASSRGTAAASATPRAAAGDGGEAAVADMTAVLDAAGGGEPVDLVGQSMGGWWVSAFTLAYPERFAPSPVATRSAVFRPRAACALPTRSPRPAGVTRRLGVHAALSAGLVARDPALAFLYQQLNTFHEPPMARGMKALVPNARRPGDLDERASPSCMITGAADVLFPAASSSRAPPASRTHARQDRRRRPLPVLRDARQLQRHARGVPRGIAFGRAGRPCNRRTRFARDGFVVVAGLLTDDELDRYGALVTAAVRDRTASDTAPLEEKSRYQQSFLQCMNLWEDHPERPAAHVPPDARAGRGRAARRRRRAAVARPGALQAGRRPARPTPHQDHPYWPIKETASVTAWIPFERLDARERRDGATCPARTRSACASSSTSSSASPRTSSPTPRSPGSSRCSSRCRKGAVAFHHGLTVHLAERRTPPIATAPCTRSSTSPTAARAATRTRTSPSTAAASRSASRSTARARRSCGRAPRATCRRSPAAGARGDPQHRRCGNAAGVTIRGGCVRTAR